MKDGIRELLKSEHTTRDETCAQSSFSLLLVALKVETHYIVDTKLNKPTLFYISSVKI